MGTYLRSGVWGLRIPSSRLQRVEYLGGAQYFASGMQRHQPPKQHERATFSRALPSHDTRLNTPSQSTSSVPTQEAVLPALLRPKAAKRHERCVQICSTPPMAAQTGQATCGKSTLYSEIPRRHAAATLGDNLSSSRSIFSKGWQQSKMTMGWVDHRGCRHGHMIGHVHRFHYDSMTPCTYHPKHVISCLLCFSAFPAWSLVQKLMKKS